MNLNRQEAEERIKLSYSQTYDIEEAEENSIGAIYSGDFFVHSENFVLVRSAQLFALDTFDHLFVYSHENLTKSAVETCIADAYEKGFAKIKPNSLHRSSYITVLLYCDSLDNESKALIKKYRKRKSFKFSIWGWMEVHVVCIDFGKDKIYHNGDGRNTWKFLNNVLHPKKRSKISKFFFR